MVRWNQTRLAIALVVTTHPFGHDEALVETEHLTICVHQEQLGVPLQLISLQLPVVAVLAPPPPPRWSPLCQREHTQSHGRQTTQEGVQRSGPRPFRLQSDRSVTFLCADDRTPDRSVVQKVLASGVTYI